MTNCCNCIHNTIRKFGPLIGRVLIAALFVPAGLMKILGFAGTAGYMASKGLPMVNVLLVLTIIIELGGGLMLLLGWRAREAALVMFLFMIPVTLVFHAYWNIEDATAMGEQQRYFMKNIAIMGGLLFIAAFDSGPLSLDGGGISKTS
jgi:putative oxidoreductase